MFSLPAHEIQSSRTVPLESAVAQAGGPRTRDAQENNRENSDERMHGFGNAGLAGRCLRGNRHITENRHTTEGPGRHELPMMGGMQKNMGAMMKDMSAMMSSTSDPSMKAQMQKVHDQMRAMMGNMQKMGGGMMQGDQKSGDAPTTRRSPPEEDHKAHHPEQ